MVVRIFKIFSFCLVCSGLYAQNTDPVLMKVGNTEVAASEFKYIYEKNNGTNADYSKKSVMDYLNLYTNFKLKVEEARSMKLDTIKDLKAELNGYRKQLASSYLIDKEITEALLKELYGRMDYEVEFSHIFVASPENATETQKEEAKAKLREIKAKIVGGIPFSAAAAAYSEDKSTSEKGGKMGFMIAKFPSGFYDLETAVYDTPVGQISDIVESRIGFHIIQVTNKRPSRGIIEVAHILVAQDNKLLADSIAQAAKKGADFESLVTKYSIDRKTNKNEGLLPPFGINTYSLSFEIGAFTLQNDGDISNPILTELGWHIIKRIKKHPKDDYDLFVRKMKSQISKDTRFNTARMKLIEGIKKDAGLKENKNELKTFTSTLDDEFYSYKWTPSTSIKNAPLITLGTATSKTIKDFADYCKKNTKVRLKFDKTTPISIAVDELYSNYLNESVLEYEEASLEKKYPDFRSLMREYEEGILLFEVTRLNVWDKANQDTTGLLSFYNTVADKYIAPEKADVSAFTVNTKDKKQAEKVYKFTSKNDENKIYKKFNAKTKVVSINNSEADKGSKEVENIMWKSGSQSILTSMPDGMTYSYLKINKIMPARKKTLAEARGYVVADYQNYLENQWLETLKTKYKVVVNKEALDSLIK